MHYIFQIRFPKLVLVKFRMARPGIQKLKIYGIPILEVRSSGINFIMVFVKILQLHVMILCNVRVIFSMTIADCC